MESALYLLLLWLGFVGAAAVCMMGLDKLFAEAGARRIGELSFWFASLAGGFWGISLGARFFRHKTRKGSFWPPVAVSGVIWLILLVGAARG